MKGKMRGFALYLLILALLFGGATYLLTDRNAKEELSYSQVVSLFKEEQVQSYLYQEGEIDMVLQDGTEVKAPLPMIDVFYADLHELIQEQQDEGILQEYDYKVTEIPIWMNFIPYLVLILLMGLFWYFMMNKQGGGNPMQFGKARVKLASDSKKQVKFDDVAGADEEKAELQEIVEFLKSPQKFNEIGARIPKGVLLVGPPGTGKTLIAKAVAGEAGVPFLSISGSDFVELYVGVGASRVRDLFNEAKKSAPAIVFIDEIDAVGRQRGAGLGGGHDEREQTLNQLLVEMDGFGANEGVIIIAATNRKDILDSALLRPGRFDRQVYVGAPDVIGREAILHVHARGKQIDPDVSFKSLAQSTAGFTGADLENLLNEAALLAARRNKKLITLDEMETALLKIEMGVEKKTRVTHPSDKKVTAYHEAGHAIAFHALKTQDPVHHVTIIPRSNGAGGFTMPLPTEDRAYRTKRYMEEYLVVCMGGRVAESMIMDDVTTGAYGDIKQATAMARAMVVNYGFSDALGPIDYDVQGGEIFLGRDFAAGKGYSDAKASQIDEEIHRLINQAYTACQQLLEENREQMTHIAEYLIRNESIDGDVFKRLYNGEDVPDRALIAPATEEELKAAAANAQDDSDMPTSDDAPNDGEQAVQTGEAPLEKPTPKHKNDLSISE